MIRSLTCVALTGAMMTLTLACTRSAETTASPTPVRSSVGTVPPAAGALEQAGHWSENLYDRAAAADWAGAAKDLPALERALDDLQKSFRESEHLAAAAADTAKIGAAVAARDSRSLARHANAVTREIALLTAQTNPTVPVEVTLLDYYGRELQIGAGDGDVAKLRQTARETAQTWARLEPRLTAAGASAERDRFGALIKRLESARRVEEFRALAAPILDEVDNLEKVFKTGP